jgi:hypothetical protein
VDAWKAETERLKLVLPYLPPNALASVCATVGLQVMASDDISPPEHAMQQPVPGGEPMPQEMPPDPAMEQHQEQPADAGFFAPDEAAPMEQPPEAMPPEGMPA